MRYYASKCHDRLNGRPFDIENDYPFLCLNPKYKATLSAPCEYILDSGAFQDVTGDRLTYAQALDRHIPRVSARYQFIPWNVEDIFVIPILFPNVPYARA